MRRILAVVELDDSPTPSSKPCAGTVPGRTACKFSIAQIISVTLDTTREILAIKGGVWRPYDLRKAAEKGRLKLVQTVDSQSGPSQHFYTPVVWTTEQEFNNPTEQNKTSLAAAMLEKAFYTHIEQLRELLRTHDVTVFEPYVFRPTSIEDLQQAPMHTFSLVTAYALLPKSR
jgi:hypothetical protein